LPEEPVTEEPAPEITKYGVLRLENNTTTLLLRLKIDNTINVPNLFPNQFYEITLETGKHYIGGTAECGGWTGAICSYPVGRTFYLTEQGYTWSY